MAVDIRLEIAERRAADVAEHGAAQGLMLPERRTVPVLPFPRTPSVICEVKRCSPSVPDINSKLDPVELAKSYSARGVTNISVLTEQNYFKGSLNDLVKIKFALPEMAVLRKDFLLTEEDVEITYRAGADAFLLIASLLEADRLQKMYTLGKNRGMSPVVELHSGGDVEKASDFKPDLVGINSRDLRTFGINPTQPLKIRSMIDWDCQIIYESGVKTDDDVEFVKGTGFDAVLVGEAVVRDAAFAEKLVETFTPEVDRFSFWKKLYSGYRPGRPLVKICGITNHQDLEAIIHCQADIAGFILAESPRKVEVSFIESCRGYDILKVGVVVLEAGEPLPDDVAELVRSGALDAIQFHGSEFPEEYSRWPGYKAVRIKSEADAEATASIAGPAVLIDAFSSTAYGGTGMRIAPALVASVASRRSLWLAGGITPDNVRDVIAEFHPELIDLSSGVEEVPGKKDHAALAKLFEVING